MYYTVSRFFARGLSWSAPMAPPVMWFLVLVLGHRFDPLSEYWIAGPPKTAFFANATGTLCPEMSTRSLNHEL